MKFYAKACLNRCDFFCRIRYIPKQSMSVRLKFSRAKTNEDMLNKFKIGLMSKSIDITSNTNPSIGENSDAESIFSAR